MSAGASGMVLVQALGWSLVHFLWQGLLVGALYALLRALIPREHSSARYAVGLAALAILAACPLLTLSLLWPQAAATTHVLEPIVVGASAASALAAEPASLWSEFLPYLVLCWISGVALMTARAVHQWRALERIASTLAWRQAALEELLVDVAARFGRMPAVRVLISNFIDSPTLIGWIRPVILIPAAVVVGFPRQQLELILAHELGHLRRYDHLANLAQTIVETLLFYHPVVHWISREVRHEREICCDNLVLRHIDGEPSEYARTLAALEHSRQLTPQFAVAASGGRLLDRVRHILSPKKAFDPSGRSHRGAWLAAAAGFALVVTTAFLSRSSESEVQEALVAPVRAETMIARAPLALDLDSAMPTARLNFAPLPSLADVEPDAAVETERRVEGDASMSSTPATAAAAPAAMDPPKPALPLSPQSLEVGDIAVAEADVPVPAPSEAVVEAPAREIAKPRLVHMVAPSFRGAGEDEPADSVGFRFSIDERGRVRDVSVVAGDASSGFAKAARRALNQWRFDPDSIVAGANDSFRQDFEFLGGVRAAAGVDESACTQRTGSHLCRETRGTGALTTRVLESETPTLAQHTVSADASCTPPTGSHVCRADSLTGEMDPEHATMEQTIILDGRERSISGSL